MRIGLVGCGHIGTVHAFALKQLRDVYYGRIKDWSLLGGPAKPINLYAVAAPLDGVEYSLRKVLFGNPVKFSPQISPDGKRLSYVAPDKNDVLQVWVQTLGQDDARQVTADKKRGIRIHAWTYAPDTLLYLQDNDGDENFHVYSV